jgi:formylglycine-generating enzyme required for sulfatase activity
LSAQTGLADDTWRLVPAGEYAPLIRSANEPERLAVPKFWMQRAPVTNAEYLVFVRANPAWQRSRAAPLFADQNYLADWAGDLEPGPRAPDNSPVVRVSWFAARAYAAWIGARLPTTAEWERAANFGFTTDNAATEPAVSALIAEWFAAPTPDPLPEVARGQPNRLGLHDLHGLVWEWIDDFNAALVTGESRADPALERDLFCGAGAVGARDKTNYPAFMRAGFRSSLRAAYTVQSLGFRCVRSP